MFKRVQHVQQIGVFVPPPDAHVVGVEDFAQLGAHEFDDAFEIERVGHALLNAGNHREFGVALFCFLQQPLRLVEQARILQRHAHAGGQRFQQAHVFRAERVLALQVVEDDDRLRLPGRQQRHQ